jgi:hypothetical protein
MRPRLSITHDEAQKLIMIRYIGAIEASEIVSKITEYLQNIPDTWTYDIVYDLRHFNGIMPYQELGELGEKWANLAQGRDMGRKVAIISKDPLIHARIATYTQEFPTRIINVFGKMSEGFDWLWMTNPNLERRVWA